MTDDIELIHSPLTQTLSGEGHTLRIEIYRGPDEPWILEIVDELGTSSVWDAVFESDQAALEAALSAIEEEGGIHNFVLGAQRGAKEAQPELMRRLAALQPQALPVDAQLMLQPLSDDELEELEQILLYDIESEESMTLEMLDGFLHALAIGPETVPPSRWLPKVWGQDRDMTPPLASVEQLNRLLGLVTRYFNSIVSDFEQSPPEPRPVWRTRVTDMGEFEDAETWAYGFFEGVQLSRAAWQPLLNSPEGRRWYRPIGLLGEDRFSADQDELTLTSQQRHALAAEIEDSLLRIHSFWLPLRQAVAERQLAQRMSDKVGRNDPCPCGSGKKFKKCCGAPSDLH